MKCGMKANEATGKETSNGDRTLPSVAESSEDSVAYEQNTKWCGAVHKWIFRTILCQMPEPTMFDQSRFRLPLWYFRMRFRLRSSISKRVSRVQVGLTKNRTRSYVVAVDNGAYEKCKTTKGGFLASASNKRSKKKRSSMQQGKEAKRGNLSWYLVDRIVAVFLAILDTPVFTEICAIRELDRFPFPHGWI